MSSAARQAYQNVEREFVTFQDRYNKGPGVANGITVNLRNLWREYVTTFLDRLVQWAKPWVLNRVAELEVVWQDVAANTVGNDHVTASAILSDLAILRRDAMQYMNIDTSGFLDQMILSIQLYATGDLAGIYRERIIVDRLYIPYMLPGTWP